MGCVHRQLFRVLPRASRKRHRSTATSTARSPSDWGSSPKWIKMVLCRYFRRCSPSCTAVQEYTGDLLTLGIRGHTENTLEESRSDGLRCFRARSRSRSHRCPTRSQCPSGFRSKRGLIVRKPKQSNDRLHWGRCPRSW